MPHDTPGRKARLDSYLADLRAGVPPQHDERFAIPPRSHEWAGGLKPHNFFSTWLVDQTTVNGVRIDRLERIERRIRLRIKFRAAFFWDEDRRIDVERLGAKLATEPVSVKLALEQTPQGCDWLLVRWSHFREMAAKPSGWDDRDRQLAVNVLGTPLDLRPLDLTSAFADPLPLIAFEGARLRTMQLGVVGDFDAFDRGNAEADVVDDRSPQANRIRREIAIHYGLLRWAYQNIKTPIDSEIPSTKFLEMCFPRPQDPAPILETSQPEPVVAPEPDPEPEPETILPLPPPPDPQHAPLPPPPPGPGSPRPPVRRSSPRPLPLLIPPPCRSFPIRKPRPDLQCSQTPMWTRLERRIIALVEGSEPHLTQPPQPFGSTGQSERNRPP